MSVAELHTADTAESDETAVAALIARARAAQARFEDGATQARYDMAAAAAAWALMEPQRNRALAAMAVETTGLGSVADKITKNHRKTLGLLRDMAGVATCGVTHRDAASGITTIARPRGVVGAVVPSTNPVATPANNVVNALKTGNAIILSPSPKGAAVCERLVGHIHEELERLGGVTGAVARDLVAMLPAPVTKAKAQALMEGADWLVVTGSQNNVKRAMQSGTPATAVGAGNVSVIVDETADLADAAAKIVASKTFDNSTSCSSENNLIVVDAVRDAFLAELAEAGGHLLSGDEGTRMKKALFGAGQLNREMLAQHIDVVARVAGVDLAEGTRFVLVEGDGIGPDHPESGEKLSLVATLYIARDFDDAAAIANRIFAHVGAGHSLGIHTTDPDRPERLGLTLPTCRVIVNQAHCFATGGAFDNAMPFSLSMGCGSWGGNTIDGNFNFRQLMNVTKVVRTIPARQPSLEDVFGAYWERTGQTGAVNRTDGAHRADGAT